MTARGQASRRRVHLSEKTTPVADRYSAELATYLHGRSSVCLAHDQVAVPPRAGGRRTCAFGCGCRRCRDLDSVIISARPLPTRPPTSLAGAGGDGSGVVSKRGLFAGHTPDEAFTFYCTAVWLIAPALLDAFPEYLGWAPRECPTLVPMFGAALNTPASLAHWGRYEPRSLRQLVDVLLAGLSALLVLYEAVNLHRGGWLVEGEAAAMIFMCVLLVVLIELDVFHKVHSRGYTTHVTGTRLHLALRQTAYLFAAFVAGTPACDHPEARLSNFLRFAAYSTAFQTAHVAACQAVASRWKLRSRVASTPDLAIGIGASLLLVPLYMAGLCFL